MTNAAVTLFNSLRDGTIVHETNVYPPRIWRVSELGWRFFDISYDAICVSSGERLQGYTSARTREIPPTWRIISNEMEVLALLSMSSKEWLEWRESYKNRTTRD